MCVVMQSDPDLYPNNLFLGLKLLFFGVFFWGGRFSLSKRDMVNVVDMLCYDTMNNFLILLNLGQVVSDY